MNAQIKKTWLGRRREPVGEFLAKAIEMLGYWSSKRSVEFTFAEVPFIDKPLWKDTNDLIKADSHTFVPLPAVDGQSRRYAITSRTSPLLSAEEYARMMDHPEIGTWGDYAQILLREWHLVTILPERWATCTCSVGLKQYRCRHSVFVEVSLGMLSVPEDVQELPGGAQRKRGRPKKATGGFGK